MKAASKDQPRRPLLIPPNQRQMLIDIKNTLQSKHSTDQNDGPNTTTAAPHPLRPELSVSTPNLLLDKAQTNRPTRKKMYRQSELAQIRNQLRPFQNSEANTTGSSSASSPGSKEEDVDKDMLTLLTSMGHDEETASRALKMTGNQSAESANDLISRLRQNGLNTVLPNYPRVNRKASIGTASPVSDSTSRSDSPSHSSLTSQRQLFPDTPRSVVQQVSSSRIVQYPNTNGHQTPPPVPPRAPIVSPSQTPPPVAVSQGQYILENGIPTQHQLLLQQHLLSQLPSSTLHSQILQQSPQTIPSQQNTSSMQVHQMMANPMSPHKTLMYNGQIMQTPPTPSTPQPSSGPVTPQRGLSPVNVNIARGQPVIMQNIAGGQQAGLYHPSASPVGNTSVPTSSGPVVTIKYSHPPPSYSQAQQQSRTGTPIQMLGGSSNEHSHMITSKMGEYTVKVEGSPQSSTSGKNSIQINFPKRSTPTQPTPAQVWPARQPPILMHKVTSREVSKPVLQTATAPVSPHVGSPGPTGQNYISSVTTQVNTPPSQQPHSQQQKGQGQVQIQINAGAAHAALPNGGVHEHLAHLHTNHGGPRPIVNIHIKPGTGHPAQTYGHNQSHIQSVQVQNLGHQYDLYQRQICDTPGSTPRSDSPVSRATNHSPLSILSTTSTPSTNSDIPDRPPPPYPGRPVPIKNQLPVQGQHPIQIVAPIPQTPRTVPLQHTMHTQPCIVHSQPVLAASNAQPPLPPRIPLTQAKLPPPPPPGTEESQNAPPLPPSVNSEQGGGNEETDTDTMSNVSDTSASQEKHRCTSPIPERKPEAKEKDKLRRETLVRNYSPQAFKFFMEQHVENIMKSHRQRITRRMQLENEMIKVGLSEEAQQQMRRMLNQKESNYIRLKRAKMDKSQFDKIETLGIGAFGEVTLVRKRNIHQLYAMKTLRKSDVLKRNQVAHVKAERDILAEADNEWVVKLYYSFQDRDNLYFVMDYVPGGDLMGLLIKFGIFEERLARFYIAELVLAIESVHKMGFIHRDIKPDNILIDKDGHIKLTDFGLCTGFRWTHNSKYYQKDGVHPRQDSMEVSCASDLPTECRCEKIKPLERRWKRDRQRCLAHSLVGTPNYIAPEVLLRSGYTSCCDWWSVGVILYEMLVGQPPFYAQTPQETQYKVINWRETLRIPPEANLSQPASNLILRLCCDSSERLGSKGAMEIKSHPFFSEIQFEGLRRQQAPYTPQILHATDTSNFDPVDPDRLQDSDPESELRKIDHPENGKHPEHAFFEFTFRRFFDDGGHPYATVKEPDKNSSISSSEKEDVESSPVYV